MKILTIILLMATTCFAGRKATIGFEMSHNNGNLISTWGNNDPNGAVNSFDGTYNTHASGRTGIAVGWASGVTIPDPTYRPKTQFSIAGAGTAYYVRLWIFIPTGSATPTNNVRIFRIVDGIVGEGFDIWWTTADKLALGVNGSIKATCVASTVRNSWRLIKCYTAGKTSSNSNVLQYEGETLNDATAFLNAVSNAIQVGFIDFNNISGANSTFYFDDIAVNDTLGTYETGYPDDSASVIYMKPVSDNAIAGWLAGAGSASNLWNALDSVPPAQCSGTIACENNTTNIYNITSSATNDYDANIQSYTVAGVPAAKTIRLVQAIARHAGHTASDAENGAVKLVSNPADAGEVSFTFNNVALAHVEDLSDTTGPNWPANTWETTFGDIVYFPSVARGTQPVARVGRRTANTNQVCVDQLGILVEYGSSAGAPITNRGYIINGE